jgi:predicted CXXCH cytochrome family protein
MKTKSIILIFIILAFSSVSSGVDLSMNSCIQCHETLDAEHASIVSKYKSDVHFQRDIGCEGCHGGDASVGFKESDPSISMDPSKGYVGSPTHRQIPRFCGKCHSDVEYMKEFNPRLRVDQEQQYRSSHHAKLLARGDTLVATCISCHGVHGILPVRDASSPVNKINIPQTCTRWCHSDSRLMARYEIPTNQFDLYQESVHGELLLRKKDTSAPTCADCHGNHGATPPGLASVSQVCGECHANNRDLFSESPHKQAFSELGLPECVACHGHHRVSRTSDELLGTGENSLCIQCHFDPESKAYQVAEEMKVTLDSLKDQIREANELVTQAEKAGLNIAAAKFDLRLASDAVVKIQTLIHAASLEKIKEEAQLGIFKAGVVKNKAEEALKDARLRQFGLAGSGVIIIILAVLLFTKIKEIEY